MKSELIKQLKTMIGKIDRNDVSECVTVIKDSFITVAGELGFTAETAPGFTAFETDEEKLLQWMNEQHRTM